MVLGNLIQINARGEQERLLYGNPQMTYFKKVYNSPSNFARTYHNIPYSGSPAFKGKIHVNVPHNGDLLANFYVNLKLPKINEDKPTGGGVANLGDEEGISYYCNGIGYKIIKSVEIKFNGKSIEKLTGEMIAHIYNYQFTEYDNDLINNIFRLKQYVDYKPTTGIGESEKTMNDYERRGPINLRLPIPFFFTKNSNSYLPICAMSNTEIEVIVEIEDIKNLIVNNLNGSVNSVNMNNISPINDFRIINEVINLDSREKKLFQLNDLNYLVCLNTQILEDTIDGHTAGNITLDINAKNATNSIYFSVLPDINDKFNDYFNYSIGYLIKDKIQQPSNLYNFYTLAKRPLLFNSNNNYILEDISIELDNSKLFEIGIIDLPFLINNVPFDKSYSKLYYQLANYNFNLNNKEILSGSLNFSRLVKKSISFKIGSDFKDYINNIAGYTINSSNGLAADYSKLILKCYSSYLNYLIIKDGLAGLKYN